MTSLNARFIAGCYAATVISVAGGCRTPSLTNLETFVEARRVAADMLVQFTKAADAGNRAVMADTDQASTQFAREARDAADVVSSDAAALKNILGDLNYSDEGRLLAEFVRRFSEYRALDKSILELAVENTNLKAQQLSFGAAQQEAEAFHHVLESLRPRDPARAFQMQALVMTSVAAVREIEVLQAPHIAESDEARMTQFEKRATEEETAARQALATLATVIQPKAQPQLAQARSALEEFLATNAEIVRLSRRNSNVRSLALSLGQKRTVAAACEESLQTLQDALLKRSFAGSR